MSEAEHQAHWAEVFDNIGSRPRRERKSGEREWVVHFPRRYHDGSNRQRKQTSRKTPGNSTKMWPKAWNEKLWQAHLDKRDGKISRIAYDAFNFPGRTADQCKTRLQTLRSVESGLAPWGKNPGSRYQPVLETWTSEQERRLYDIISRKERDWTTISGFVGGLKSVPECERHWHSMLESEDFIAPKDDNGMRENPHDKWTREEDAMLWDARHGGASYPDIIKHVLPARHRKDNTVSVRLRFLALGGETERRGPYKKTKGRARDVEDPPPEVSEADIAGSDVDDEPEAVGEPSRHEASPNQEAREVIDLLDNAKPNDEDDQKAASSGNPIGTDARSTRHEAVPAPQACEVIELSDDVELDEVAARQDHEAAPEPEPRMIIELSDDAEPVSDSDVSQDAGFESENGASQDQAPVQEPRAVREISDDAEPSSDSDVSIDGGFKTDSMSAPTTTMGCREFALEKNVKTPKTKKKLINFFII